MSQNDRHIREALARIIELASEAVTGNESTEEEEGGEESEAGSDKSTPGCTLKHLPKRLLIKAAETARKINPVNAPHIGAMAAVGGAGEVLDPLRIAVMTAKYWGPSPRQLTVSFMETTPAALRSRIISHMNAWTRTACISFVATSGTGNVRISRGPGGFYSYLGTDILHIPSNRPTMNLERFTMDTPESEYKRVVRHETGHTLGFPHEHMRKALVARIDKNKAYRWFLKTYGWDKPTVDAQVLTPLSDASIVGTPEDQTSIMCYQLPGDITKDGLPITGGVDINATDFAFAGRIYPRAGHALATPMANGSAEEWSEAEDVAVEV